MNMYLAALSKYATLAGRSVRREYWTFFLINQLVPLACAALTAITGRGAFLLLAAAHVLAVLVPGFAVTVRRLHDVGRSGSTLFWALVPGAGGLFILYLLAKPSDSGANQFGLPVKLGESVRFV